MIPISTAATCIKGKKIIQEKYTIKAEIKAKKVQQLNSEARKIAKQYREKREDVLNKESDLSSWQTQLDKHENEFTDLSKIQGRSISVSNQLSMRRCQQKVKECKETIFNLEEVILAGKQRLKDITDSIADCDTQIRRAFDELSYCKEILQRNNEWFENERQRNIQEKDVRRTAETVAAGGGASFMIGWTMGFFSPLTG